MPAQPFSRRHVWPIAAAALAMAGPAWAQSPRAVRYRATIDAAGAKSISLTTQVGQQLTLSLASDTVIDAVVPFRLEDIATGSYIGSAAMPQPDGTLRALEVHVFPESMRGTGEGYRPFDLEPRSTMTNGTVGSVTSSGAPGAGTTGKGRTLVVHYPDGEKIIVVPPDTPVVTFEPGSPALLVPGAHCIVMGIEASDGKLSATRIAVGKNGLVPPM